MGIAITLDIAPAETANLLKTLYVGDQNISIND